METFTEPQAAAIIHEVLLALDYLHTELHVAHRDLKPENLMFQASLSL